ncbi:MAG: NADH-quinone oxidoreductase subunit C, partial [Halosimplex sp.]
MAEQRQRQVGEPSVDAADEALADRDADSPLAAALAVVPDDAVTDTERHLNAPALVVRADRVQATLAALRDEAGLDHCACVTGQAYGDRHESIYHLRSYDDPTRELSVVVPVPAERPRSESGARVYPTADWHEREAYDLVGIEYDDHPDLRRILLPETWQGHPLGPDYDGTEPQIVTFREHENPLADDHRDGETLFLNMGPHHPATHGVLHLGVTLDGEHVAEVTPDIGYIHRCEEQMCQQGT